MNFKRLELKLSLHQEISIIYVVDGFEAIFYKNEYWDILEKGKGNTIKEALKDLEKKLSTKEDMSTEEDKNNS